MFVITLIVALDTVKKLPWLYILFCTLMYRPGHHYVVVFLLLFHILVSKKLIVGRDRGVEILIAG